MDAAIFKDVTDIKTRPKHLCYVDCDWFVECVELCDWLKSLNWPFKPLTAEKKERSVTFVWEGSLNPQFYCF